MRTHAIVFLAALAMLASGCASSGSRLRGGADGDDIVKTARRQIGRPYRYGGGSPSTGFDCSGLVGYVFGQYGVKLPHSTGQLMAEGRKIPKGQLKPGDLVFFDINGRGASHVGIYTGDDQMVHAPSTGARVREDRIAIKYWISRYVGARRLE